MLNPSYGSWVGSAHRRDDVGLAEKKAAEIEAAKGNEVEPNLAAAQ